MKSRLVVRIKKLILLQAAAVATTGRGTYRQMLGSVEDPRPDWAFGWTTIYEGVYPLLRKKPSNAPQLYEFEVFGGDRLPDALLLVADGPSWRSPHLDEIPDLVPTLAVLLRGLQQWIFSTNRTTTKFWVNQEFDLHWMLAFLQVIIVCN